MIKSIEDLQVWQKSRLFNKKIYHCTAGFPPSEKNNLTSQLRRASASICANIAEGFGRYHPQESIQFYRTARGSLLETKSHLYLALDQQYLNGSAFKELLDMMDEIGKMLNAFINQTHKYRTNRNRSKL